jgi:cytochrome c biogenesis protein
VATQSFSKVLFWPRWVWKQLTSMRTALFLLLFLALAAVPGSVYPQRSADPNGVRLYFSEQPELAEVLDSLQLFDVYTSVWFSAIYILLFISLVGCVMPRTKIHWEAMLAKPVQTPTNLKRMPAYLEIQSDSSVVESAHKTLKKLGFRSEIQGNSVSAERGYIKETGNLIFHYALIGVLIAVGVGGGFSYSGQRVLVEGEVFVNNLASYDAFNPGPLFYEEELRPFKLRLDEFEVVYDLQNLANRGIPIDFIATVTKTVDGVDEQAEIRVNHPVPVPGANVFLTGNGYAPVITLRDGQGNVSYSGPTIFLPQDGNMTSLGVIKAPDALPEQVGIIAFFYPTAEQLESGAYTSIYPDPFIPLMTMNVYTGDLGLDDGIPRNVYALETSELELVAGRDGPNPPLLLEVGDVVELPNGLGSVSFDGLRRFASLDIAYNPGGIWVLGFAMLALFALMASLLIPRRRVWVRQHEDGTIELAALARGDDARLDDFLLEVKTRIENEIVK